MPNRAAILRWLAVCFTGLSIWLMAAAPAAAHEVRPAYLEVIETAPGTYDVTWKQPVLDGRRLKIDPVFPERPARAKANMSPRPAARWYSAGPRIATSARARSGSTDWNVR
ncbi:MAG: hypothetical protein ACPH9E_09860 [Hyphomonas sp.]